jgi:hypothetical protein
VTHGDVQMLYNDDDDNNNNNNNNNKYFYVLLLIIVYQTEIGQLFEPGMSKLLGAQVV